MRQWKVIYGGQEWVTAENEEEAYQVFWEQLAARIVACEVGLIVESREVGDETHATNGLLGSAQE